MRHHGRKARPSWLRSAQTQSEYLVLDEGWVRIRIRIELALEFELEFEFESESELGLELELEVGLA